MATGARASGEAVMVSRPFNWCTVALLMATKRCLSAEQTLTPLLASLIHCNLIPPEVTMGTLSELRFQAAVTRAVRGLASARCRAYPGELMLMTHAANPVVALGFTKAASVGRTSTHQLW